MTRILIFGAGRMARSLLSVADEYPGITVVGVVYHGDAHGTADQETPLFNSLPSASESLEGKVDLVIDFSLAAGTPVVAQWCRDKGIALLSGVTGLDDKTHEDLDAVSEVAPVLWAPNLSFGVNLLAGLIRQIGSGVARKADISVEEVHHAGKRDAPSGTALFLAEQFGPCGEIEFHSIREGDVIGEHAVTIALPDETLTLAHVARDRRLFARGALQAAEWLVGQSAGRYSAADWISGLLGNRFPA